MGHLPMETRLIRPFLATAFLAALMLGACAVTSSTTPTDAQLALTDGEAILTALEAAGKLPPTVRTDAGLVIAGLQAILAAYDSPGGGSEQQTLATTAAAVQQVVQDSSDARVKQAGQLALAAIEAAAVNTSANARVQVESALGAVLLDYLATAQATQTLARR